MYIIYYRDSFGSVTCLHLNPPQGPRPPFLQVTAGVSARGRPVEASTSRASSSRRRQRWVETPEVHVGFF